MKSNFKFFICTVLTFLSACSTSRESLLNNETFYTNSIDRNYIELGKCIKDQLNMPAKKSSMLDFPASGINTGGRGGAPMMIFYPTPMPVTVVGIESYEDTKTKTFYVGDFITTGDHTLRNWVIIINSTNDKDTTSDIQLKSRKTIFGKPRVSVEYISKKIEPCL